VIPSSYDRGPTWSPDGKYIAFSSRKAAASYGYIYVIGVDGTGLTALTSGEVRDTAPNWSPDGKQIAFMRQTCCGSGPASADIYVMDADGAHITRLTQGERSNGNPAWSPDGRYIAWMTLEGDSQNPIGRIAIMNSDGTNQAIIPLDISVSVGYTPAWSPDGQQLVFVHQQGNRLNLYRVNRDGTNLTRVTDDLAFFSAPAWSPPLAEP
jgi:Tol biopolymer transport system component